MKPYRFALLAFVVAACLTAPIARAQKVPVGGITRDFTLVNHATGAPLKLSDYAGKVIVLDFFAYWCGPCQVSSPDVQTNIQNYYNTRGGNGSGVPVVVISISIDQTNKNLTDSFIKNAKLDIVGDDVNDSAWNQFDTGAIPTFVIINGLTNSSATNLRQWQVLTQTVGYPGAASLRQTIETVKAPSTSAAPAIQAQPSAQNVLSGKPVTFSVAASGWPTPQLQWRKDGQPISGATSASLSIASARTSDSGNYSVVLTNNLGTVTSSVANLSVFGALVTPATKELGSSRITYQSAVTSGENWSVSSDSAWLNVSSTSGNQDANLQIVADANATGSDRTGKITVGGFTHTVTQRAATAALRELWSTGTNHYGQLGDNRLLQRLVPYTLATGVKSVAAGISHTLVLKSDGTLWASGLNTYGQLGDGSTVHRSSPVQVAAGVQTIAAGGNHSLFLKTDGSLWGMGLNSSGQLGLGNTTTRTSPVQIANGVQALAAGSSHSLFVKTDGTLWAMGYNFYGQLGDGSTSNRTTPVQTASNVQSVAAGTYHSLFLKADRTLWSMGYNYYGQVGDGSSGTTANKSTPIQVSSDVSTIAAGGSHTLFTKTNGSLWAVGANYSGQLGNDSTTSRSTAVQVATGVQVVSAGSEFSLYLKTDGTVWAAGDNGSGQFGDGSSLDSLAPKQIASSVQAIAAGGMHSLWLKNDGSLQAVGANSYGQLGDGTNVIRLTPTQIDTSAQVVATGTWHSLWIKTDGSLWGAGYNYFGQLGDGTTNTQPSAVRILPSDARAIAAGYGHSMFLKTDGTLWGMGYNSSGQLGDGSTSSRVSPVQVASGVRSVVAGAYHSLILKTDGTLWTTGINTYGQLGDGGTGGNRTTAMQVATDVRAIAAGYYHSMFLKNDGTLWGMGYNALGQLGDRSTTNRATPVQAASDVRDIAAGDYFSLFTKTDGTLWGMGSNSFGQLGDGSTATRTAPVQLATNVRAMAAGNNHSLFITTDNTLWATGSNSGGQLGDGTSINKNRPVQIAASAFAVAAGNDFTLFATSSGAPAISAQPAAVVADLGTGAVFSVTATGADPLSYQWRKDGVAINGSTNSTLTVAGVQLNSAGNYDVVITSPAGSVISSPAALTVGSSRLSNLSVRSTLADGQILIVGFGISGNGQKQMLIRGIGPALAQFGVSGTLADPQLRLFDGATQMNQNDDWGGSATMSSTFTSVGAFGLAANSKDAALLVQLSPKSYSAQVSATTGSGVTLVEVYDADANSSGARLTNVSARNPVGTGANVLVIGFAISGSLPKTLLMRGVGPSLAQFGVGGVLADPVLTVFNSGGATINSNNDWGGGTTLSSAFDQVGAFGLPTTSKDAALVITLQPGTYTAQISGANNTTGVALVEVYELP